VNPMNPRPATAPSRWTTSPMISTRILALVAVVLASLSFTLTVQAGPRLDRIIESKVLRVGTPGDYRLFAIKTDGGYLGS
jgi:cyclohexadienyl dehydratase